MKIENIIRKYKKKIEYKTETINDYKESHNPELLNSVPIYEKEIAEMELIIPALELAQTKAEGRLVVLPCKLGDTVYWIENGIIKSAVVQQFGYESYIWISGNVGRKVVILSEKRPLYYTKEAAEKALGGAEDGD